MGWMTGLEPATPWTTTRRSNQLSYTHHKMLRLHVIVIQIWHAQQDSNLRPFA